MCVGPLYYCIYTFVYDKVILCNTKLIEMHYLVNSNIGKFLCIQNLTSFANAKYLLIKYSQTADALDLISFLVALTNKYM